MNLENTITILEVLNLFVILAYIIYQSSKGLDNVDILFNYLTLGIIFSTQILYLINRFSRFEV